MNSIKKRRVEMGLTQEQLAKRLKIHRTTVVKWETNKSTPKTRMLPELSKVLDISIEELLNVG
ncbi:MAG: helix-turn-helix transcriptional regulator [Burkholderiales bacterium]|jgi:transcriptional regulator with XRE-family HTH domain